MKIKNAKDFWAGAMFVAFGLGFAIVARNYPMGSGVRMGPAYFPTVLGLLLAVLGLAILVLPLRVRTHACRPSSSGHSSWCSSRSVSSGCS